MNKTEYYNSVICHYNYEYKQVQKLLKDWKTENNITERCVVHHRDDTDEAIKYNEEHYELWGFNEDGTFEYDKYVVFMTQSEHFKYHNKGDKNPMYDKKHSDEAKAKMSIAHKGKIFSDETKIKLSAASKGENNPMYGKYHTKAAKEKMSIARKEYMQIISEAYKKYKLYGGVLMWHDFRKQYKNIQPDEIKQIINNGSKV